MCSYLIPIVQTVFALPPLIPRKRGETVDETYLPASPRLRVVEGGESKLSESIVNSRQCIKTYEYATFLHNFCGIIYQRNVTPEKFIDEKTRGYMFELEAKL
jgi:hypothetical protein